MERSLSKWLYSLFWILAIAAVQACAPLTAGTSNTANCLAAVVGNSQGVGLGQTGVQIPSNFVTVTTNQLAQSFLAPSATAITTVSLNLDVVAPVGQLPNGFVQLDIEPDSTISLTSPTPTSPNTATLGTAQVPTSGIQTQAQGATFITFSFTSPITLTSGQIFWLVATPIYAVSSTTYVEWRAASGTIRDGLSDYFSTAWQTFSTSLNLNFKIGC
jgi:hypothetical protein